MKRLSVLLSILLLTACDQNKTVDAGALKTEDANAARTVSVITTDEINLQSFEQIPAAIKGCSGLFVVNVTDSVPQYVLAHNLKGTAYIKLNGAFVELKLIKQTNIDKQTVNELYTGDNVEIELKITQGSPSANKVWDYNGVLILRKGVKQEAIAIAGKLGC